MHIPSIRAALLQVSQLQLNVEHNIADVLNYLTSDSMAGVDLLLLPEMWTTGFTTRDTDEVTTAYHRGEEAMREISARFGCAVYGSLLERKENGLLANVALFVDEQAGISERYQKVHLFRPGGEAKYFEPGTERKVVVWRGWRLFLSICYDLRFPVWMRHSPTHEYDAMLCTASWPRPRQGVWQTLLLARAIDNQAYVLGCNRVGNGPKGLSYSGDSLVSDPKGTRITEPATDYEGLLYATLDKGELEEWRRSFPVLSDADPFTLL